MKPWLVVTPEYGEVIPVTDEGQGPFEYGADVVFVEAETRRDAIRFGVMLLRQMGAHWFRQCDGNPYAGIKAESMLCPAHGVPTWVDDHYECARCEAILEL